MNSPRRRIQTARRRDREFELMNESLALLDMAATTATSGSIMNDQKLIPSVKINTNMNINENAESEAEMNLSKSYDKILPLNKDIIEEKNNLNLPRRPPPSSLAGTLRQSKRRSLFMPPSPPEVPPSNSTKALLNAEEQEGTVGDASLIEDRWSSVGLRDYSTDIQWNTFHSDNHKIKSRSSSQRGDGEYSSSSWSTESSDAEGYTRRSSSKKNNCDGTVMVEEGPESDAALQCVLDSVPPSNARFIQKVTMNDIEPPMCQISVILFPQQVGALLTRLDLLEVGDNVGCGSGFGVCSVSPIYAARPLPESASDFRKRQKEHTKGKKHRSISHWIRKYGTARMSVEEIRNQISDGNSLSFDFYVLLIGASIIASVGLATDSAVMVVASMLISPLMGPILATCFGAASSDSSMFFSGLKNEFIAFLIVLVCGFLLGLALTPLGDELGWPTNEMAGRGTLSNITIGIVFAVASGLVVGVSVTGGGINSLVGVAISASLLPPVVNSGMCLAYALVGPSLFDSDGFLKSTKCSLIKEFKDCGIETNATNENLGLVVTSHNLYKELSGKWVYGISASSFVEYAIYSLLLFIMNIVVIFFVTLSIFELKQVRIETVARKIIPGAVLPNWNWSEQSIGGDDIFSTETNKRIAVQNQMKALNELRSAIATQGSLNRSSGVDAVATAEVMRDDDGDGGEIIFDEDEEKTSRVSDLIAPTKNTSLSANRFHRSSVQAKLKLLTRKVKRNLETETNLEPPNESSESKVRFLSAVNSSMQIRRHANAFRSIAKDKKKEGKNGIV
eukprot:g2072.t1